MTIIIDIINNTTSTIIVIIINKQCQVIGQILYGETKGPPSEPR